MKWIKKLFGKKESLPPEASRGIDLEEIPVWLDEGFKRLSSEIAKSTALNFQELNVALSGIKTSNEDLENAKVEGDFDIRIVKRAKSNRENVIKQIGAFVEKVRIPDETEVPTIKEFHDSAVQNLDICIENMNKSYQYVKVVFPAEAKEVTDALAVFGKSLSDLQGLLSSHKEELEAYEIAFEALEAIRKLSSALELEKSEIKQKEEKILALKTEIAKTREDLENIRQGETWTHYQSLKEEIAEAEEKVKKAESGVDALILPLAGNLSKLMKLHESGRHTLNLEQKKQIELCLKDPKAVNPAIFPEFLKLFEENVLELKAPKKEKAENQVRTVTQAFESRQKEYMNATQSLEEKKENLSQMDLGPFEELTQKESGLGDKIEVLEKELEISRKKVEAFGEELEEKKARLQESVSIIDSSVRLTFTSTAR